MAKRSSSRRVLVVLSAAVLIAPVAASADPALGGAGDSVLGQQSLTTPDQLGKGTIDGLQYGDATSKLALVDPPGVSSDGAAHLSYPLVIPPGRGITPELSVDYDSGGKDGWVGQGWDISAGDISVDTRWGAPRFDPDRESETYDVDGQMLVPNALGATWAPRVSGDRQDYTRQVETEYQQIIRHEVKLGEPGYLPGPATENYYWEIHDKGGNVFWYGGTSDDGGPIGSAAGTPKGSHIDRSAIVTDEHGNGVRWLLSAQRDVGVNRLGYTYATVHYSFGSSGWVQTPSCTPASDTLCAKHTYLSDIYYTGAATKSGQPFDPPYDVHFVRESALHPEAAVRKDPTVDAMGGFVDLTIDRLARIEVRHGSQPAEGQDVRKYDELAVRYDLDYTEGAFGKSLLSSVSQVGSDGSTTSTHTFDYYDRVGTQAGGYDGFGEAHSWDTGDDLPDKLLLDSSASISALGGSESNSAEGHAYIGFNPIIPEKVGSVGGSLQIGGGATDALSEWLDINGDGLPDKVFRDGGVIKFRLNQARPGGTTTFSEPQTAQGISKLSHDANIGVEGAVEAFPGVSIAFGLGAEVSWGDAYFADANADGLPDYVSGGSVYFNHLENGVPHFVEGDSASTEVPLEDASASVDLPDDVKDVQQNLAAQNPLVDTVRRWTAPFTGTVSVDAPVTFAPPAGFATKDGVRVAIQHNGTELAKANLLNAGSSAFGNPIDVDVNAGDRLYFRVGSVSDGTGDQVTWSPTVTYTAISGVSDLSKLPADANGLSQTTYSESDDFTLSGRPDTNVLMPYGGNVHFSATVDKNAKTTDDLRVVLKHNGQIVGVANGTIGHAFTGSQQVSADFAVAAPVVPENKNDAGSQDSVTVQLVSASPIDLRAVSWNPAINYTSATDRSGSAIDLSKRPLSFDMTPEVSNYPQISTRPSLPIYTTGHLGVAHVYLTVGKNDVGGTAVVTVKNRDGVVARGSVSLPQTGLPLPVRLDTDLNADVPGGLYWFDVTIADPRVAHGTTLSKLTFDPANSGDPEVELPATLYGGGLQGIFPVPHRGWAAAGYNADGDLATGPLVESSFVVDTDGLKDKYGDEPTGFGDADQNPTPDKSYAYLPQVTPPAQIPGHPSVPGQAWVGNRAELAATSAGLSASRLSADSPAPGAVPNGSGRAVTRVGIAAPQAKLAFGVGPLSASFGIGPSFGLVDYQDMNGDGYPDVVTPNKITYTTPRGAYGESGSGPAVVGQDLTMSVGFGIESGLVDIKANSKGRTNATHGGSAQKGGDAESDGGGVGLGGDVNLSWTNPNASGDSSDPRKTYGDQLSQTPSDAQGDGGAIQLGLADVNGDGLADRVSATPDGVFAHYNLGYGFTAAPVKLSTGGFDSQESYSGGLSLGFSTPWADFSGGVALNWDVDLSRYAWVDVNGDGILDQLHKVDGGQPTVRFGTGSGMLAPVSYGDTASASSGLGAAASEQVTLDRSNGLGGQFDFTVAIGPLCLVACYLIINPGASYQNSVTSSEVDVQDVNGDGYADSLISTDDDRLTVRENRQADTNLLSSVHNPLGGSIGIEYQRDGNTVDNPGSSWKMSSVTVNDGRPGDGVDVTHTGYTYDGLKYDKLQRASLGYSSATETEYGTDGTAIRRTEHRYLNDNVFNAGLETDTLVKDASDGTYISGTHQTWALHPIVGDTQELRTVAALTYSMSPLLTRTVQEIGTGEDATTAGESTTTEYTYDDLGDVIRQADLGEDDDPNDDVVADMVYTRCANASSLSFEDGPPCVGDRPIPRPSPFYDAGFCGTWVSIPGDITVSNGKSGADRVVYRHRNGAPALCDNASVTHLEETIGAAEVAETDLTYDDWGSYNRIVYPLQENGTRYAVCYDWDHDGHGQVGTVTEYQLDPDDVDAFLGDGLEFPASAHCPPDGTYPQGLRSTATFDPLSGGVASRTDANGNTTTYTYDPLGRIASVSSPVASDPEPLVRYDYSVQPGNTHVIAHHFDAFNPGDPIDTAVFVDGLGRVVQTKRDAALYQGPGQPAQVGVVVSGATIYDDLQRAVRTYNPRSSAAPMGQFDDTAPTAGDRHTDSEWDLWDEVVKLTEPGNRVTTSDFEYGSIDPGGPQLFMTTVTAPNNRQTVQYTDVRDVLRASDDVPVGAPSKRTRYDVDGMGQLRKSTDPSGYVTTNSYDQTGKRLSTSTPDGGLVQYAYDAAGQLTSETTPNLRAAGQKISYHYGFQHLVGIDYPGTADDVSYLYGGMGAAENGAGQVVREEDGARITTNGYDAAGDLTRQTATIKLHNWTPTADQARFTWTTRWSYDGLGRIKSVLYPDSAPLSFTAAYNNGVGSGTDPGEQLAYDYDAGGQLNSIVGSEQGVITQQVGVDPVSGAPINAQLPHTWNYTYLSDRQYDVFLNRRTDTLGNGDNTVFSYDPDTQRLAGQRTVAPGRNLGGQGAAYQEIQDLKYTYDSVGNPLTYRNDLPPAVSSLFGGPSSQTYSYDPYERLVAASGQWQASSDKNRRYTLSLSYDAAGNLVSKNQRDVLNNGKKDLVQDLTTYSNTSRFTNAAPHQPTTTNNTTLSYDRDGNLTRIADPKDKTVRSMTWDAADRMRLITDGPQTTTYNYDDQGNRTIERGPAGETATLNPWVTIVDGAPLWKHIWAGDDRIATQRDDGPRTELDKQYFLHKDLQGSTNAVTNYAGDVFQHHEYFAGGEQWVTEDSTVYRTAFQYAGGYLDEQRDVINLGARWYDQIRNMFYSPEPLLTEDPTALQDQPGLTDAYSYALSNPVGYVDPTGYRPLRPGYSREKDAQIEQMRKDYVAGKVPGADPAVRLKFDAQAKRQERFEMIDDIAQPFVEINISTGEVRLGPGLLKTWAIRKGKTSSGAASTPAAPPPSGGAANGAGGPINASPAGNAAPVRHTPPNKPLPPIPNGAARGGGADAGRGVAPVRHTPPNKPLPRLPGAVGDI